MKVGLIGCGGMGTVHNLSLKALSSRMDVQVAALADCRGEFLEKAARQWPEAATYRTGMELLEQAELDSVHICLPSYLHTDHAVRAMERGMNVFIEKPVCLTQDDCARLLEKEKETGVRVMVGQVVRFFDEYRYLKQIYDDGRHGRLKSLVLTRVGGDTDWGYEDWFHDPERSGSVVLDLHVHDVDFLRYLLGEPDSFRVRASALESGMVNQILTTYRFGSVMASAEGAWHTAVKVPFRAQFRADFERATVEYDGLRTPTLMVYPKDCDPFAPELRPEYQMNDGSAGINITQLGPYYTEIKDFVTCLAGEKPVGTAPLSEGVRSVLLALREYQAALDDVKE